MKKIIIALLMTMPGLLPAQQLSITATVKHAQNVVFPNEVLPVTVQVKENGKPLKILPDAIFVNGVANGNSEFGTITQSAAGIYKYNAPAAMPAKPGIAISASIKNAKGEKIIAVKNIYVIATKWLLRTDEFTQHLCAGANGTVAYTMEQVDSAPFELGDDLYVKVSAEAPKRRPMEINDVSSCHPEIFKYEVLPGKGELLAITSGRLIISAIGNITFNLNGKLSTSDIGMKVYLGGELSKSNSFEPDQENETIPFNITTSPLNLMRPVGFENTVRHWEGVVDENTNPNIQPAVNLKVKHTDSLYPFN
ncbi:hypothetical protein [Mucilaginibacter sp.]|uniref:hypothetical protein n=1 Tax=Mucilaginibacter sp. TaxID=1882438 RepID=UPI0025DC79A5|nr:hypothetical protein [Mucilaginibacter sp.]